MTRSTCCQARHEARMAKIAAFWQRAADNYFCDVEVV